MLPNFLVIGAAKAGTTALWHYLCQHPQVFMSPVKEPRFFATCDGPVEYCGPGDKTRFEYITDLAEYKSLFAGAKDELAIGEVSPWYFYVPSAAPAIKKLIPDVKLVVILREPVDRAFSNYLHAVREGLEPLNSFKAAMAAEPERILAGWSPRFHYKQKGFYYQQLNRFKEHFPEAQIRVYLYDDFLEHPQKIMDDLFQYIGVDTEVNIDMRKRHNVAWVPRNKAISQILRDGNWFTRRLKLLIDDERRLKIKKIVQNFNKQKKPILAASDLRYFGQIYLDDIKNLELSIDRPLDHWKLKYSP